MGPPLRSSPSGDEPRHCTGLRQSYNLWVRKNHHFSRTCPKRVARCVTLSGGLGASCVRHTGMGLAVRAASRCDQEAEFIDAIAGKPALIEQNITL